MNNMMKRHLKATMGANFEDWACGYFSRESGHLDTYLARDEVFAEYQRYANVNRITMQSFTTKLKSFCKLCPWVDCLNPPELQNNGGRIQRAVQVSQYERKTKDMIYVRSLPEEPDDETHEAVEQPLIFDPGDNRPF